MILIFSCNFPQDNNKVCVLKCPNICQRTVLDLVTVNKHGSLLLTRYARNQNAYV